MFSNPAHGEVYSIQHYVKFVTGRWFSMGTLVSSTNKTDRHDIAEIVLKVELNTITPYPTFLTNSFTAVVLVLTCISIFSSGPTI